jgi:ABC-type multidrug transport system fused ATPase/permease subunit
MYSLYSYIAPYKKWLIATALAALANVVIKVGVADAMRKLLDTSLSGKPIGQIVAEMFLLVFLGGIVIFIIQFASGKYSSLSTRHLRTTLLNHVAAYSVPTLGAWNSGALVTRIIDDVSVVQRFLQQHLYQYIFQPFIFVCTLAYMLYINWQASLFCLVALPIGLIMTRKLSVPLKAYAKQLQMQHDKINFLTKEAVDGIAVMKSFQLEEAQENRYAAAVNGMIKQSLLIEKRVALMSSVRVLLENFPFVLCVIFCGYLTFYKRMSPGELLAFIQLLNYLIRPVAYVPDATAAYKQMVASTERLFEITNKATEKVEEKVTPAAATSSSVVLDNVTFSYDGQNPVLHQFSLDLSGPGKAALVGPSGSGKSTIFHLLCGFYTANSGEVRLFNHPVNKENLGLIRQAVSLVPQDVYLFPMTVAQNIALSKPDASQEEIIAAAEVANAHDFISQLPNGYDTIIGEKGTKLSGGQRQRLGLARAVLKDAPVLLLDEPTSSLDSQSEQLIGQAIDKIARNRRVLIIAHRLSTIRDCEDIYVISEGSLIGCGGHSHLMDTCAVYRNMYRLQSNEQLTG